MKSYGSDEVRQEYAHAEALLPSVRDDSVTLSVYLGLGIFNWLRADYSRAVNYFEEMLHSAQRMDDDLMTYAARAQLSTIQYFVGKAGDALAEIRSVLAEYDPEKHGALVVLAGQDYGTLTAALGTLTEDFLGNLDASRVMGQQSVALARSVKHPFSLGFALAMASLSAHERGDTTQAIGYGQEGIDICKDQGFPYWGEFSRASLGLARARQGEPDAGAAEIEGSIRTLEELGSYQTTTMLGVHLARALMLGGHYQAVIDLMKKHVELISKYGQYGLMPSTRLMMGQALLAHPDRSNDEAEAELLLSIQCAREQKGKLIELRAAIALARLWQSQGKAAEAHHLLAPVCNWFTEGLETPDLIEAKTLIDNLR